MKIAPKVLLMLAAASTAFAQTPTVAPGGIFNAASYAVPGLPNAPIAQGSLFVVFGSNMGPAALQQITSYPLPTALAGTTLTVTVSGTSVKPFMVYTSAGQIAAVLPSATPVGTGTLTVAFNGATSGAAPIQVVASSFGIFTVNQKGSGAAIITDTNFIVNAANRAANPGEAGIIWGTGLGPVSGDEGAGPLPGNLNIPAEVYVGGKTAAIIGKSRAGCCAGLDQIAFTAPSGVEGCSVPVAVKIGNVVSNFGSMAIAATGRICSDPNGIPTSDLQTLLGKGALNLGSITLFRSTSQSNLPPPLPSGPTTTDTGSASFNRYDGTQAASIASFFTQTSLGACTILQFNGQSSVDTALQPGLDAGPTITIAGPGGSTRQLQKVAQVKGLYSTSLGTTGPNPQPLFLDQGTFTADNGTGGADVGKFSGASVQAAGAGFTWTNQASFTDVDRSKDQTVTWSGGAPNTSVTISGFSSTAQAGSQNAGGALFTCMERAEKGTFQIPAVVLLGLPASASISAGGFSSPTGSLSLMNGPPPVRFTAPGLDYGTISFVVSSSKGVTYK